MNYFQKLSILRKAGYIGKLDFPKSIVVNKKFNHYQNKSDEGVLQKINAIQSVEIPLEQFDRIMHQIIAPADHYLLVKLYDEMHKELASYNVYNSMIMNKSVYITEQAGVGSDGDPDIDVLPTTTVELEWINSPKYSKTEKKNFFRYLTKEDYHLEDFQVYYQEIPTINQKNAMEMEDDKFLNLHRIKDEMKIPCFLFALKQAGVSNEIVKSITATMIQTGATIQFINNMAKRFNLHISVKQIKKTNFDSKITHYGDKKLPEIKLGSVGMHLFAIKPTSVSKIALLHPEHKDHINFPSITLNKRGGVKIAPSTNNLDSYQVISFLYRNRDEKLTPITQQNVPELLNNDYQDIGELTEDDFDADNFKALHCEEKEFMTGTSPFMKYDTETKTWVDDIFNVVYFDFETTPNKNVHQEIRVSFHSEGQEVNSFEGTDCAERFLKALPKGNNLLWAHNAGFDFRFIVSKFSGFLRDSKIIDNGTRLKQASGTYFGRKIVIKDTMSFLNYALAKFPKLFPNACDGITLEKESFPHHLVSMENFDKNWDVEYLKKGMEADEFNTLITNATRIGAFDGKTFNTSKYSEHYCNRDVIVMESCFKAFRQMFIDRFNIDVYRFLSMPSIAYAIQYNEGCFKDCYSLRGVPLAFARKAIVGGRVMTNDNKMLHNENPIIKKLPTYNNETELQKTIKRKFIEHLDTYVDGDLEKFINDFQCDDACLFYDMKLAVLEYVEEHPEIWLTPSELARDAKPLEPRSISKIVNLILDFDAASLYPSAMVRMPGYVKGTPKLFKSSIPDCDYFIVKVKIDSLEKKRQFPLQSIMTKEGTRDFTNDIVGKELIMGKEALDDLVNFQDVSYTVIEGMYWNNGFNDQITKTIRALFNERIQLKLQKNPLQEGIKLLMNSGYGKLIQKPIDKEKVLVQDTRFEKKVDKKTKKITWEKKENCIQEYLCKNINKIISKTPITDSIAMFEQYTPIYKHFSPAHLGVQVLDSSKHIMNEVMCLAEDIGAFIAYQDTDSCHISRSSLKKLKDAFKEKYNRELDGEDMGQFNSDFDLDGSKGEVYATESYFLGKKSYLDCLSCTGNNVSGMHIRMKGVPSKVMKKDTLNIYKKLYEHKPHEFDMTQCCPLIIDTKRQQVLKRTKAFTRMVQFL